MNWTKLMSDVRRKDLHTDGNNPLNAGGDRTEIERDYDRVLFSAPVRRLADKTQVFPLEKNDSVRTRLTHSYEVSNIARSIGVALAYREDTPFSDDAYKRSLPAMLATVGLAHDIGNPPFGHQGENAIGEWFKENDDKKNDVFSFIEEADSALPEAKRMKLDFLKFEGNAQALRILTKLQIVNDNFGLNLTCGSLAALMKYPTTSEKTCKSDIATKKFGCFHSDLGVAQEVWQQTGLKEGQRHPLTFLMEASDDIAYSVMDVEDAVKKGLISYRDLIDHLVTPLNNKDAVVQDDEEKDPVILAVVEKADKQHKKYKSKGLSPNELNDLSMQIFRVFAIGAMVTEAINAFLVCKDKIEAGNLSDDLIDVSAAKLLCKKLKSFALENAYKHRSVLELELKGHAVIHSIMDMLWPAIVSRGDPDTQERHPGSPFEKYAYGRISENYRRIFEDDGSELPLGYRRCQLLSDMISGMTDTFALSFEEELKALKY